ncbi:MAG TPA: ABC transporter ATP-binding protein, partial [Candidatus Dorea intestinavium]|nr:ABC transporter ATP-binding protein [Candidatus Dorea intestinavium]
MAKLNKPHGKPSADKPKNFKGAMKKLGHYMSRYKIGLIFVVIFAMGGTIFQIVGPKILGRATTEIFKGLMSKISGKAGIDFTKIGHILLILLALYLVSAIFNLVQGFIMTGISQKLTYHMRKDIVEKINRLPMSFFDEMTHGEILSRITNDVDTLSQGLNQSASQVITSATMIIGVLVMMISISPLMTLVALLVLPVSMGFISIVIKKSQKYFYDQQKYLGNVNGQVEEIYSGHAIVKVFNKENDTKDTFDKTNEKLYKSAWKSQFISGI